MNFPLREILVELNPFLSLQSMYAALLLGQMFALTGTQKRIGDAVSLYYVDGNVSGLDFGYQAGSQTLSFGYIVALAGDFYANYKFMSRGCVEQISDSWTSQPEQSIKLFQTIAKSLSSDSDGYLKCIVTAMAAQEKDVQDGISKGKDPAQVSFGNCESDMKKN